MAATTIDPYAVLGIPAGATRDQAARAHRRLAKQFHPDINAGPAAAERMRRINEAWRILSNPTRRARHDAARAQPAWPSHGSRAGTHDTTWASWSRPGHATTARTRRPPRPAPVEPTFGDRPAVVLVVWFGLAFLLFIGTWLGSLAR